MEEEGDMGTETQDIDTRYTHKTYLAVLDYNPSLVPYVKHVVHVQGFISAVLQLEWLHDARPECSIRALNVDECLRCEPCALARHLALIKKPYLLSGEGGIV
jgi:hypothetical protein